jgi:anti-sigma B factor antagonist
MQIIKEENIGQSLILALEGELLGGEQSQLLQDRIYEAIRLGRPQVVLDLSRVKWMNSSGLGVLMGCMTSLRSGGGDLKLVGVSDRVKRPIQITRLDSVLSMHETIPAAVASFEEGG